jgi:hypothetical protein
MTSFVPAFNEVVVVDRLFPAARQPPPFGMNSTVEIEVLPAN